MPSSMGEQCGVRVIYRVPFCLLFVVSRVDLDIEGGTSAGYAAFINKIRSLAAPSGRKSVHCSSLFTQIQSTHAEAGTT